MTLAAALLVIPGLTGIGAQQTHALAAKTAVGTVKASGTILRKSYSTKSKSIGNFAKGKKVKVSYKYYTSLKEHIREEGMV